MNQRIYLDYNASTPVDPRVIDAMMQHMHDCIGNPSSVHSFGRDAKKVLTHSRDLIAKYLGVKSNEIIFTSGGTESSTLFLRGYCERYERKQFGHIITTSVEHSCVYNNIKALEKKGWRVTYLNPSSYGAVTPESVLEAIEVDTKLIAIMAANNETGVITDIESIAKLASERQIPFFVDGVIRLGNGPFTIPAGVSAMGFSGQKIYAPKGIGFVFIRENLKLEPLIIGGPQQFERRGGTGNLPGIVGLAKAISLLEPTEAVKEIRDYFESEIKRQIPTVLVNGEGPRIPSTSNLAFSGVNGESLLTTLDMRGIAVSHGSACSSGALEPSRVLLNMGYSRDRVSSSIRFSFGRTTTREEIDRSIEIICDVVRSLSF